VTFLLMTVVVSEHAFAQGCKPVSERTGNENGCWILSGEQLGQLPQKPMYWHLINYSTRAEAEAAKGPSGTVIDAFERIWLSTIAEAGGQTLGGTPVAEIGPLPGISNEHYTAHYMEAVSAPGNTSRSAHRHDGPEAWYNLTGKVCLETPEGTKIGDTGESAIVPPGPPMTATTVGTELRRSLVLVLHETAKPWVTQVPDWTPKGLCKL